MGSIDRSKVRKAFHRQADRYDQKAVVQKLVVANIVLRLKEGMPFVNPRRILDVGSGTGMLLRSVRPFFPDCILAGVDLAPGMGETALRRFDEKAGVSFVAGDAENLPFAADSFDLVLSTSTFQWLNELEKSFAEIHRVLAPGGGFVFALFGERTLWELRTAYRKALLGAEGKLPDHTHRFFGAAQVRCAMEHAGFRSCRVRSELEREFHEDVTALLRTLRDIGAGNASMYPPRGLAWKKVMTAMMDIYRMEFGVAGGIPATYEVLYGEGIK